MNRRNQILVGALVVQLMLVLAIALLRAPAAATSAAPLFSDVKGTDVQQITVQDGSGAKVELAQKGGTWVMPASDDFPANDTKISTFIDKLLKAQSGHLIARTATSYERLKVADDSYTRRVDIQLSDGKTHTLLLGTSAGGTSVYARADGAAEVWAIDAVNTTDASVAAVDWITSTLYTLPSDQVDGLVISNANGTFEFSKVNNAWVMKGITTGENLDQSKLSDMLTRVTTLYITAPLGKSAKTEYGLQPPAATITLTLQQTASSNKPVVIQVGAKEASDSTYAVFTSESPYYARVSSYTLDDFVSHTRANFLVEPTAVPTGATGETVLPTATELPVPTATLEPVEIVTNTQLTPAATVALTVTVTSTPSK